MDLLQNRDDDSIDNHDQNSYKIQLEDRSQSLPKVRKSTLTSSINSNQLLFPGEEIGDEKHVSIDTRATRRSSTLPPIPSATDLRNSMDESEDRLRQQQAIERTRLESIDVDQMLKGEEMIKERQRGISRFIIRRQSIYPLPLSTAVMRNRSQKDSSLGTISIQDRLVSFLPSNKLGSFKYSKSKDSVLSFFETAVFAYVLQKLINELGILRFVIPVEIDESWNLDSYQSIEEKYGTPEPKLIFRKEMNFPPLILPDMEKLQRDRTYLNKILEKILREIKDDRKCYQLQSEKDYITRMEESEEILQLNHTIYQYQVKTLREIIKESKQSQENEKINLLELEEKTRKQIDESKTKTACTLEYTERLERVNIGEAKLTWLTEKQKLMDELKKYTKTIEIEQRVSEETCNHIQTKQEDFENDIKIWTDKRNEEFEQRNQEIDRLKEKIEHQKIAVQDLHTLEEVRQNYIDECLLEEEKIAEEVNYWKEVNKAAMIIQSLWKGYMVRHQLGQFRDLWARLKKRKKKSSRRKKKPSKKSTK